MIDVEELVRFAAGPPPDPPDVGALMRGGRWRRRRREAAAGACVVAVALALSLVPRPIERPSVVLDEAHTSPTQVAPTPATESSRGPTTLPAGLVLADPATPPPSPNPLTAWLRGLPACAEPADLAVRAQEALADWYDAGAPFSAVLVSEALRGAPVPVAAPPGAACAVALRGSEAAAYEVRDAAGVPLVTVATVPFPNTSAATGPPEPDAQRYRQRHVSNLGSGHSFVGQIAGDRLDGRVELPDGAIVAVLDLPGLAVGSSQDEFARAEGLLASLVLDAPPPPLAGDEALDQPTALPAGFGRCAGPARPRAPTRYCSAGGEVLQLTAIDGLARQRGGSPVVHGDPFDAGGFSAAEQVLPGGRRRVEVSRGGEYAEYVFALEGPPRLDRVALAAVITSLPRFARERFQPAVGDGDLTAELGVDLVRDALVAAGAEDVAVQLEDPAPVGTEGVPPDPAIDDPPHVRFDASFDGGRVLGLVSRDQSVPSADLIAGGLVEPAGEVDLLVGTSQTLVGCGGLVLNVSPLSGGDGRTARNLAAAMVAVLDC